MTRRTNGLIGTWAEAQRQEQRRQQAQQRAVEQERRERERQQRAAERAMAQNHREQQAEYRRRRDADARARTEEIDAQVAALEGLLAAGTAAPAFRSSAMLVPEQVEPFAPGQLAVPIVMPNQANYQPSSSGWGMGANQRAQQEARARFERDWYAAQAAETQRVRQLEEYRRQYDQWAATRLAELRRHNAGIRDLAETLRSGDSEAAIQFFSAVLYASSVWPQDFPRRVSASYDANLKQLVLDWELPAFEVVPEVKSVRYMPSTDQDKETARSAAQRRGIYRDLLAQCVLLVLRDVFAADEFGALDSAAVNGFVDDHDPATGNRTEIVLASAAVAR
ncbi:MAG: restriction endonuclease, partial [Streptomycetaceae bacterium]|nr:restriction endonuclease [Streptomycetaceae bacterium]